MRLKLQEYGLHLFTQGTFNLQIRKQEKKTKYCVYSFIYLYVICQNYSIYLKKSLHQSCAVITVTVDYFCLSKNNLT